MDIDNKICPEFSELACFVRDGYYQEIDDWFEKHQISRKPALQRKLTLRILDNPYFFSFQSFSTNLRFINQERVKRESSILKNLKIENQLLLFSPACIEDFSYEHLGAMKLNKKNKEILCNSNRFSGVVTKLFNKEEFDEINKIDEILELSVLEIKTKGLTFHYKEKNSHGAFYIELENKIFSPKHNIVFAYTKEKEDFLKHKNIILPDNEDVDYLYKEIKESLKENKHLSHLNCIEKVDYSINEYKTLTLFEHLNNNLTENQIKSKKIKI